MIKKLNERLDATQVGAKAAMLSEMTRQGFRVPSGMVIEKSVYETMLKTNRLDEQVDQLLQQLNKENVKQTSQRIQDLLANAELPTDFLLELEDFLNPEKEYAVRSSGLKEDLDSASFAGQYETYLGVGGLSAVCSGIMSCYQSMFGVSNLTYLLDRQASAESLSIAVIVQEYVEAEYSGVAFTVDPVTGKDQTLVIELAEGTGEALVGGFVEAFTYRYDWFEETWEPAQQWLLPQLQLEEYLQTFMKIQRWLGYPCDLEFAVKDEQLFLLQARPITSLSYSSIQGQWTTANFQDGGVSAQVCSPFMWSLYHSVWDRALSDFLVQGKIFNQQEIDSLLRLAYGRPYWNVGMVKQAMAKFPGYVEKDFDNELGITIGYTGNGHTTTLRPGLLLPILQMARAQMKRVKGCLADADTRRKELLRTYHIYADYDSLEQLDDEQLIHRWTQLVTKDYLYSETTYFQQVYLNTIQQTLFKDSMLKRLSYPDYLLLLGGLSEISHTLPYKEMWQIRSHILQDPHALLYWRESSAEEIAAAFLAGEPFPLHDSIRQLIRTYGYHSERELNIEYPLYVEAPDAWLQQIQALLELPESYAPEKKDAEQQAAYQGVLDSLVAKASTRESRRLKKKIEQMRTLLWWREEFRDISTRYYALIRMYTLRIAEILVRQGVIRRTEQIWMFEFDEIRRWLAGDSQLFDIKVLLEKHQDYYTFFRNFQPPSTIGDLYQEDQLRMDAPLDGQGLQGVGCNQGMVTGRARVINDLQDIHQLQTGEILVTRFTDTGWTSKFAVLTGIITETGGVLCHAAICAREYGVPCIVCAKGATSKIQTGMKIEMDGASGTIRIVE